MSNACGAWAFGQAGEDLFRKWFLKRGYYLVPACLIETGGAPRLEGFVRQYVLPDFQASAGGKTAWVEVKSKRRADYMKVRRRWESGFEKRKLLDYLKVQEVTGIPAAVAFVHAEGPQGGRIYLGLLEHVIQTAAFFHGPFQPGHPFQEPMAFFELNRFDWFDIDPGLFSHAFLREKIDPVTVRPWEKDRSGKPKSPQYKQGYLPGF